MRAALRSRAAALPTDLVLLCFVVGAGLVAASLASSIPDGLAGAPDAVRARFRDELALPAALITAVVAALYAGFDYTLDLRNGVVAREVVAQPRLAVLGARATMATIGGAAIGLVCGVGVAAAGGLAGAGFVPEARSVLATVAVGAVASVWGVSVGVLVRHHLLALFVVPVTLGLAIPLGQFVPAVAAWMPLPAFLGAVGVDTAVLLTGGPARGGAVDGGTVDGGAFAAGAGEAVGLVASGVVTPVLLAAVWLGLVAAAATARFARRDIT